MKIEHLTVGGSAVMRNSRDINLNTMSVLSEFKIAYTSQVIEHKNLPFKVKITATEFGAMFNIEKEDGIAYLNVCCFDKHYKDDLLGEVKKISKNHPFLPDIVTMPRTGRYLYTVPILPVILSPSENIIAGEVEFYIYYQLYLAYKSKTK